MIRRRIEKIRLMVIFCQTYISGLQVVIHVEDSDYPSASTTSSLWSLPTNHIFHWENTAGLLLGVFWGQLNTHWATQSKPTKKKKKKKAFPWAHMQKHTAMALLKMCWLLLRNLLEHQVNRMSQWNTDMMMANMMRVGRVLGVLLFEMILWE